MEDGYPVTRLVHAILLSATKKHADAIRLRRAGGSFVEFLIDGTWREEMRPPVKIHAPMARRLAVIASLPTYGPGEHARGVILLTIKHGIRIAFAIRMRGHGDDVEAELRPIDPDTVAGAPIVS